MKRTVEVFLGPMACACSGLVDLKEEEKHTRAEMVIEALEKRPDEVDLLVHRASDEEGYPDLLQRLSGYLRNAGEDEFADRVAFSIRYVTPAIVVDGELRHFGRVPGAEEFLEELFPLSRGCSNGATRGGRCRWSW